MKVAKDLLVSVDRDLDGTINFSEQLLMRRAAIAWKSCAQETMNRAGLRCGLSIVVQGRNMDQSEADAVFKVGKQYINNQWTISFPVFVLLSDLYKTFSIFNVPVDNGVVGKGELLRHLAEMEMPHRITLDAMKKIFKVIDSDELAFAQFAHSVIS